MGDKFKYEIESFEDEILREYDVRGIVNKNLNDNVAYTLGLSFGQIVYNNTKNKKIVVGYDGRFTSISLQKALCQGLMKSGLDVTLIGLCPTPMLYYAINYLNMDAGLMVTGSHNPPNYNGFKMVLENKPFYSSKIQELKKNIKVNENFFFNQ